MRSMTLIIPAMPDFSIPLNCRNPYTFTLTELKYPLFEGAFTVIVSPTWIL
jgi:hypothetical protein